MKRRVVDKRKLSVALSVLMACSMVGTPAAWGGVQTSVNQEEGACNHVHDENCYDFDNLVCELVELEHVSLASGSEADQVLDGNTGGGVFGESNGNDVQSEGHQHGNSCYQLNCVHAHDEDCGYEEPVRRAYLSDEVQVLPGATVSGVLKTESGTPLAEWPISIYEGNNLIKSGITGKRGEYHLSIPGNGEFEMRVNGINAPGNSILVKDGQVSGIGKPWYSIPDNAIPGVQSATLTGGNGKDMFVQFAPTSEASSSRISMSATEHTVTEEDIENGAEVFASGSMVAQPRGLTVSDDLITIEDALQVGDKQYKIGECIDIGGEKCIIRDIIRDDNALKINRISDGMWGIWKVNNSSAIYDETIITPVTEKNETVNINGVEYYLKYEGGFSYIYVFGDHGMEAAGKYFVNVYGDVAAVFNKEYDPKSLKPIQNNLPSVLATLLTKDNKTYHVNSLFSYNIDVTGTQSTSSGNIGTMSFSGLGDQEEAILMHAGRDGYSTSPIHKGAANMLLKNTSPFMIFSFTELNTEIPVKTITTNSENRGSDSSSSSGGSAYNPNILRGTWVQTNDGIWMFRMTDGAYAKSRWGLVDGLWYYFNSEGKMLTGWQLINSRWYYLCTEESAKLASGRKEGAMLTGWYFDPTYQGWFYLDLNGAMVTGWKEIGGQWYYFYENGVMAANTKVDGYELGPDGAWKN